jgi:hypothetical protein
VVAGERCIDHPPALDDRHGRRRGSGRVTGVRILSTTGGDPPATNIASIMWRPSQHRALCRLANPVAEQQIRASP